MNKATHLLLLVRHAFMVGFMSELKGDPAELQEGEV